MTYQINLNEIRGGYLGKLLRVDLSKGAVRTAKVDRGFALKYVGGRGWGARIVWDEIPARVDPLGPKNKLCIMTGPLTGVRIPCSAKTSFNTISPATGYYGDSNIGGFFGARLKQSGFDGIVLEGISKKPVCLWIENGKAEIRSASEYWGKGSLELEREIKKDLRDTSTSIVSIGPAGENLVKFACITGDYGRQAGRCGMGTVMGSKRVKFIAAQGSMEIPIANPEMLKELFDETMRYILKHDLFDIWRRQGTMQVVDWSNENASLPTRNFLEAQYELYDKINGDAMEKEIKAGNTTCFACPIACGTLNRFERKRRLIEVIGPEYETAALLGSNCALPNIKDLAYANYLCDNLGLDTISSGNVSAFAMECYEKGILTKKDLGGLDLRFGNSEALFNFLEMIGRREGIGDLFAEGVEVASENIGKGSERFAMHVKGLEITGYDHRAAQAMALSYATCDIGAHHNRSWAITHDIDVGREKYGEDKAKKVIFLQHIRPLHDCLGVCRFPYVELNMDVKYYVQAYTAATGIKTALDEMLNAMDRVWNLTRCISLRNGMRGSEDWLPDRVFKDAVPKGILKGSTLDEKRFKDLLQSYYRLRGWGKNGIPSRRNLEKLGLKDVADQLTEVIT